MLPDGMTPWKKGETAPGAGRKKGKKTRATIARNVLGVRASRGLPSKTFAKLQELHPEISAQTTLEEVAIIVQVAKAITRADTNALSLVMNLAYRPHATRSENANQTYIFASNRTQKQEVDTIEVIATSKEPPSNPQS